MRTEIISARIGRFGPRSTTEPGSTGLMPVDSSSGSEDQTSGGQARVPASSADDGCGAWGVRCVFVLAEDVAEGVDGLALEAESDVGLDAGVGVAEELFDHDVRPHQLKFRSW
ncbi:hypothetical protein [Streptomyces sp. HC307]|uniref:hypothetical protein n=1 Tax=Streptomyces flavusporus TaxID=3385496 RepID=UPI003917283A